MSELESIAYGLRVVVIGTFVLLGACVLIAVIGAELGVWRVN
jgi:hypothetical protein